MAAPTRDDQTVTTTLTTRFLDEPVVAEAANLVLGALLVVMLFGVVPKSPLLAWFAALSAISAGRAFLRRTAARRVPRPETIPWTVIFAVGAVGLCWSLGAFFLLRHDLGERELVMIVECGVAAAATASLAPSRAAFVAFSTALFVTLIVALLLTSVGRAGYMNIGVTFAFWGAMAVLHRRNYNGLSESIRLAGAVRESEQRLFKILEAMPVGVIVLDKDVNIYYGNAAAQAIGGVGLRAGGGAESAHLNPVFMPGTDDEYPRERLPAARALAGESITDQFEVRGPDGPRLIEVHGAPIRSDDGDIEYGVAVLSDMGSRQGGEQRRATFASVLRVLGEAQSESDLLAGVLATIGSRLNVDVAEVWLVDRAGTLIRRAESWIRTGDEQLARFDAASEDLSFERGAGLPGRVWRDGAAVWRNRSPHDAQLFEREGGTIEAGLRTAIAVPLHVGGRTTGALSLFTREVREHDGATSDTLLAIGAQIGGAIERRRADAELRQAEQRYRQLMEASSDLVWGLDLRGHWTFLNGATRALYGREPEEMIGRPIAELSVPETRAADMAVFERLRRGETITEYETVHLDRHGKRIGISTSAAPIIDANGKVVGYHGILRDISARAAARDALREARDAAQQAAAAKSAFLANMSHEIRTPLNGILGMSELLLDGELDSDQRRAVELVALSGRGLLEVINDILDFSKIEAGQMDIEAIDFDLHELLDATVRIVTPAAQGRGVEVVTDIVDGVPAHVIGDPTRLRQVITNLLGNAVKFTHQGEIVVTVSESDGSAAPGSLRFTVSDTGIGMAPATLASIFEPFKQADSSTTRRYGGTGLGLTISRALVDLMGGVLIVDSAERRGSTFGFTIPLPPSPTPAPVTSEHRAPVDGVRILVVDDNSTNQRVIGGMLRSAGCIVETASDPIPALELLGASQFAGHPIQLIVTDVQMPGMDGLEFLDRLRAQPATAHVPVIVASSGSRRGDRARASELHVSAYLLKPISRRELLNAVAAAVGGAPALRKRESGVHPIMIAPHTLRILLAEDNPINQQVAASMLRRRGHAITIVDDGHAAVRAALADTFDVVLMDIQMPELDGIEATRQIRAHLDGKPLAIIALTANAMSGERERCLAAGMDGYLSKPFAARDLFAAIEGDRIPLPATSVAAPLSRQEPAVDIDALRAELRAAEIEESLPGIITLFLDDSVGRVAAIEAAAAAKDAATLSAAAHALKSAAATLRCNPLAAVLKTIELESKAGRIDVAVAALPALRAEFGRARDSLQTTLGD